MQSSHGSHVLCLAAASCWFGTTFCSASGGLLPRLEPSASAASAGPSSPSACSAASREASRALRAARIAGGRCCVLSAWAGDSRGDTMLVLSARAFFRIPCLRCRMRLPSKRHVRSWPLSACRLFLRLAAVRHAREQVTARHECHIHHQVWGTGQVCGLQQGT